MPTELMNDVTFYGSLTAMIIMVVLVAYALRGNKDE